MDTKTTGGEGLELVERLRGLRAKAVPGEWSEHAQGITTDVRAAFSESLSC